MRLRKDFLIFVALVPLLQVLHKVNCYEEVHTAKMNIDSLFETLTSKLLTLKMRLNQTREKIAKTTQEIATVKRIRNLFEDLNKHGSCEHEYMLLDFSYKQRIIIEALSDIPDDYTVTIQVPHKKLVDEKKAEKNGNDLRVFYLSDKDSIPVELDRLVDNLYTNTTTVQFRLQRPMSYGTIDRKSYALLFGGQFAGKAKSDPRKVLAFYEDFESPQLKGWKLNWGKWRTRKGKLIGKITQISPLGRSGGVGIYLRNKQWGDIEVELDIKVTGKNYKANPGPYLRVKSASRGNATSWSFRYETDSRKSFMIPYVNGKGGVNTMVYSNRLYETFMENKWFHIKYRLHENIVQQWFNGTLIQYDRIDSQWMIPKGTIGLGCEPKYVWGPKACVVSYDNIKVKLLTEIQPDVSFGNICNIARSGKKSIRQNRVGKKFELGTKARPAVSCKQIYKSHTGMKHLANGVYWIKTAPKGNKNVSQTFCDISKGGWTLIGKISGSAGNIFKSWLVKNVNVAGLGSPKISPSSRERYASLDARFLAVRHSSEIMFSSGDKATGVGSKWVRWQLPHGRRLDTLWNHGVGYSRVKSAISSKVTVYAWNGRNQTCYQNKYAIMPLKQHGGSYPYVSYNKQGNTIVNDYCMSVGVLLKGSSANGWSQNANGYDSPQSDSDWPNGFYNHQRPYLLVWLK